ncbi:MAG: hypothetical protein QW112_00145 [Candidatus Micrarchaeia archaeon]
MAWNTTASNLATTLGSSIGAQNAWLASATLAVSISFSIVGIIYALGYVLNMESLKRLGKAELLQAIASALLVALLFGFTSSSVRIVELLQNQTEAAVTGIGMGVQEGRIAGGPYAIVYPYLDRLIECSANKVDNYYKDSMALEMAGNIGISTTVFGTRIALSSIWAPTYMGPINEREYMASEYTWLTIVLYLQRSLLLFVETSMFTIFLPVGIILRAFPPTRGAGAVLVAVAIGFYIVYPAVYSLFVLATYKGGIPGCDLSLYIDVKEIIKSCPLSPTAATETLSSALVPSDISVLKAGASELRYYTYIYFMAALGSTLIFIRSVAGILGADIGEIGRSMIRLI